MSPILSYFTELNSMCYHIHRWNLRIEVILFHIYDKNPNLNFYPSSWCCDSKIFVISVQTGSPHHRLFLNSTTGCSLRHGASLYLETNDMIDSWT